MSLKIKRMDLCTGGAGILGAKTNNIEIRSCDLLVNNVASGYDG